jgi:hypothetical protein
MGAFKNFLHVLQHVGESSSWQADIDEGNQRILMRKKGLRAGGGGPKGGVSPGAGAQGTKDGPLGVGPMPVLSEPLGSSISDHGSAGLSRCRDPPMQPVVHRNADPSIAVHRFADCRRIRLFIRKLTT